MASQAESGSAKPFWLRPLCVAQQWPLISNLGSSFPLAVEVTPTFIVDVFFPVKASGAIFKIALVKVYGPHHTLVSKIPHEQLQANQGENTQAEHGQDHHIRQLLHRLNEGAYNCLQA